MISEQQALDLNYNIHISEDFGFVFFNNPKAGCSTTKATLNLACAARLGAPLQYRQMHDIHAREGNVLKTTKQVGAGRLLKMLEDPATVTFCVLREPVSRIASAYGSKFRGNSPQKQRLNTFLNRPADADWQDINEWVAVVTSDPQIRDFDPHWRLQYNQVCGADLEFTVVGFQEELDASLRRFSRRVFGDEDIEIFDARQHFKQNVSRSDWQVQSLTPDSLALLRAAYAEDFAFYEREWRRMHPDDGESARPAVQVPAS